MKTAALIILAILPFRSLAQNSEDLRKFNDLFAEKSQKHNWGVQLQDSRNELTFIFSTAFVIYKEVFSSQDIDACVFTPSCSVYAIESIKQKGAIVGFFMAIDRLTRCNPGPKKGMQIDLETRKYLDPVEPVSRDKNFKDP
jgi:putative component of membrane protein insertase Oxa1/YidC/SpoIIIJ protein YidD